MEKELIKIYDNHGFHYEVELEHNPRYGFTHALYNGRVIATRTLNKLAEPWSDDDREWEEYEERFSEWKDAAKVDLEPMCKEYFNNQEQ